MIGQTFGSWTVIADLGIVNHKHRWMCRCTCGKERAKLGTVLAHGLATHCLSCARSKRPSRKRGRWHSAMPEYKVWCGVIQRCRNHRSPSWEHYGARGITVCARWRESFEAFMDDMGERPSAGHSIDRIDVNGHYEPGNCRWATVTEQMRNRTDSRFLEHGGERLTAVEWSERLGVSQALLYWRIKNWGVERALVTRGLIEVRP